jgi:phosphatidylserine/phosphatidylglycerophosphate/cardiolipin synthase-like enzyme
VDAALVLAGRRPAGLGFAVLERGDLASPDALRERIAGAFSPPASPSGDEHAARLDLAAGSRLRGGHRVLVRLDNAAARRELLEMIEGARRRIHFQVYIARRDAVSAEVGRALGAAAARGVEVRFLADSLFSLHGSLGSSNPFLARLGSLPGVDLRVGAPLSSLPGVVDLKRRDHRKLVIFDGAAALVTGRNLAREYYTGFDEVHVSRRSSWTEVPWLDAGARLEGPLVADLDEAFRAEWVRAGGAPFEILPAPEAGSSAVRVVLHEGLEDARTLEAYLALIDGARARLHLLSGFPLHLEVQHALLRAIRRGVRVRLLAGTARPLHEDGRPFRDGAIRDLAEELTLARLDPLVEAGAEVFAFTVAVATKAGGRERIRPYVHAKALCADGAICVLGSANFDVTAAYWESEVLLVVEDAAVAGAVEQEVEALIEGSAPLGRVDGKRRRLGARRAWLSRYWPSIVG